MNDLFSVKERKILVTGGARGIGKTVAQYLASAEAHVGIVDVNGEQAKETAKEIQDQTGSCCRAYVCDVTDPEAVSRTVADFIDDFETIDAVFNNAGITDFK